MGSHMRARHAWVCHACLGVCVCGRVGVWVCALGCAWVRVCVCVSSIAFKRAERGLASVEGSGEGGDSGKGRGEASWGF